MIPERELRDLLKRVRTAAEKMAIANHGLPNIGGDILALVAWVEETRASWGIKPRDDGWDGGTL